MKHHQHLKTKNSKKINSWLDRLHIQGKSAKDVNLMNVCERAMKKLELMEYIDSIKEEHIRQVLSQGENEMYREFHRQIQDLKKENIKLKSSLMDKEETIQSLNEELKNKNLLKDQSTMTND